MTKFAQNTFFDLELYLKENKINDSFHFSKDIFFHWSNWSVSTLILKDLIANNQNNELLKFYDLQLEPLKSKVIWLCNKMKSLKSSYYALYESYLDSRLRLHWFDRKEEILYSEYGEQGPFNSLSSMKWFSKEIYELFIQRKILTQVFPLRSFRLNTNIQVNIKFDNNHIIYSDKVEITQFSTSGILLKFSDKNFINKIKNSQSMEFYISDNESENIVSSCLNEFTEKLRQIDFNSKNKNLIFKLNSKIIDSYSNALNVKRCSNNEFYFFASYADFSSVNTSKSIQSLFVPVCLELYSYLEEQANKLHLSNTRLDIKVA